MTIEKFPVAKDGNSYVISTIAVGVGWRIYDRGSVFKLSDGDTICIGNQLFYEVIPDCGEQTAPIYLRRCEFTPIDFVPSPLYNKAVKMGFVGSPHYFEFGHFAVLERQVEMVGGLSYYDTLDSVLEEYVKADDAAKAATGPEKKDLLDTASTLHLKYITMERLVESIKNYNTRLF